jgi:hypothetical protein
MVVVMDDGDRFYLRAESMTYIGARMYMGTDVTTKISCSKAFWWLE